MAEILVKAVDANHSDPDKDRRGCYKAGMPVVVMDDGHEWGREEGLPNFVILKIPEVPKEKVVKYIDPEYRIDGSLEATIYRRRLWQLRWADLPLGAKDTLRTGFMTIKATQTYIGPYDYTWAQIKDYFRNNFTGLNESWQPQ